MQSVGNVYLVGAGPGDPKLITVGGQDALKVADVVVYDRLAHPALLDHAPQEAEKIYVGKQADQHALTQDAINALLAERANRGQTVVRLKGGDPFVFGRGGEEAEYLIDRGIPVTVIPGVTSAIAALAYAGIPVTHRDAASSFAVITGHERDDRRESGTRLPGQAEGRRNWERIAHAADTLVFLMGRRESGGDRHQSSHAGPRRSDTGCSGTLGDLGRTTGNTGRNARRHHIQSPGGWI